MHNQLFTIFIIQMFMRLN